jgi:leucyl aminopeptidase
MDKLTQVIKTTKTLIDLPYNRFNLENCFAVLHSHELNPVTIDTAKNLPIKLMSGNNFYSRIITSNYKIPTPKTKNIYIVGKGILFDSGGLNLKDRHMEDMTNDKAGMIIAMNVVNYLKGNVIAFCPVTTNFIQNSKITPGDIISIGKKDVKITNTDAEGRLILAEALSMLKPNKDDIIITLATLTGAAAYAVGEEATAIMAENEDLLKKYAEAAFEAKELAWALPLWNHYQKKYYDKKLIDNSVSEIKCGTSEAGLFLKQFVPNPNNWIHLDIAYSAFTGKKANGVPVRSLINFIKKLQKG